MTKSIEVEFKGVRLRLRRVSSFKVKLLRFKYSIKLWIHTWIRSHTALPLCDGLYGPCFCRGHRRVQNTAYVDEKKNWVFLCDTCMEANDEYWNEMWREYYGSVL